MLLYLYFVYLDDTRTVFMCHDGSQYRHHTILISNQTYIIEVIYIYWIIAQEEENNPKYDYILKEPGNYCGYALQRYS